MQGPRGRSVGAWRNDQDGFAFGQTVGLDGVQTETERGIDEPAGRNGSASDRLSTPDRGQAYEPPPPCKIRRSVGRVAAAYHRFRPLCRRNRLRRFSLVDPGDAGAFSGWRAHTRQCVETGHERVVGFPAISAGTPRRPRRLPLPRGARPAGGRQRPRVRPLPAC